MGQAMGYGKPRDSLDRTCKIYKECHKCVRDKFGDTCTGELFDYKHLIDSYGEIVCTDKVNSCERNLCECDLEFSQSHYFAIDYYSSSYNHLDSKFVYKDECVQNSDGNGQPACCQAKNKASSFSIYNSGLFECCADGTTRSLGLCSI